MDFSKIFLSCQKARTSSSISGKLTFGSTGLYMGYSFGLYTEKNRAESRRGARSEGRRLVTARPLCLNTAHSYEEIPRNMAEAPRGHAGGLRTEAGSRRRGRCRGGGGDPAAARDGRHRVPHVSICGASKRAPALIAAAVAGRISESCRESSARARGAAGPYVNISMADAVHRRCGKGCGRASEGFG